MKLKIKFSQRETMTVSGTKLAKHIQIVPDFDSIRLTQADIREVSDKAIEMLGKRLVAKRMKGARK